MLYMEEENILFKNIRVEFLSTKTDHYNNEISYFKIKDRNIDQKFKLIMKDNFKLPWFKTDKNQNILKVKRKYVKLKDLVKDKETVVDINFKYYEINDTEGYYVGSIQTI